MKNIKPSSWIVNQVKNINSKKGIFNMVDLASGYGRHSIYFAKNGFDVIAVDNDKFKLDFYPKISNLKTICFDLEDNNNWPFNNQFDLVLVVNYLNRKKFKEILNLVKVNGFLIYDTFSVGNEKFGKPSNPDFLLKKNELRSLIASNFTIEFFFEGKVFFPKIAIKQRCVAKRVAL